MGAGGDVSARLRKGSKAVRHTDCRCKTHFKHSCSPQNPYAKQQVCPACTAAAQVLRWAQAVTAAEQLKTSLGRRAKHLKRLGPYFFPWPGMAPRPHVAHEICRCLCRYCSEPASFQRLGSETTKESLEKYLPHIAATQACDLGSRCRVIFQEIEKINLSGSLEGQNISPAWQT